MRKSLAVIVAAAAMATVCASAQAALYNYSVEIDLADGSQSTAVGFDVLRVPITGATSFPLRNGDTISGTVTFANNQAVQVYGPGYSYAYLNLTSDLPGAQTPQEATISLINPVGVLAIPQPQIRSNFGNGAVGPLTGAPGGLTTSVLSFSGFQYSLTLTSSSMIGGFPAFPSFTPAYVEFASRSDLGGVDIVQAAAVPEPSTYALMIAGLGAVGFVAARRRKETAA